MEKIIRDLSKIEILGVWSGHEPSYKVFSMWGFRYTGQLVFDPRFEERQMRKVRKNSKAKYV